MKPKNRIYKMWLVFRKFDGAQKNMPNHYLELECLKVSQAEKERTAAKQLQKMRENSND